MALEFNGIEAVRFGEIVETPVINNELRLRISEAAKNQLDNTAMADLISSAFPQNKDKIKEFIENQMSIFEVSLLLAYLFGGNEAVEATRKSALGKMGGE